MPALAYCRKSPVARKIIELGEAETMPDVLPRKYVLKMVEEFYKLIRKHVETTLVIKNFYLHFNFIVTTYLLV